MFVHLQASAVKQGGFLKCWLDRQEILQQDLSLTGIAGKRATHQRGSFKCIETLLDKAGHLICCLKRDQLLFGNSHTLLGPKVYNGLKNGKEQQGQCA